MEPISIQIINDQSIFDILQSLLVPIIAIVTTFIAYKQWRIEKTKSTHNLFEKRFKVFQNFNNYISHINQTGNCSMEQYNIFISQTAESEFIFGDDIATIKKDLNEKGMKLWAINEELKSDQLSSAEKRKKLNTKMQIQKWFLHKDINKTFVIYMKIIL